MRVVSGRPFRFAQHLERMTRGADFQKIKWPFAPKELEKFAAQLIEQSENARRDFAGDVDAQEGRARLLAQKCRGLRHS